MHLPDEVECGLAEAVTPGRQEEALLAKATIIRWEINGKVVAYSYGLIPISKAYKQDGKWVYEGEIRCSFLH